MFENITLNREDITKVSTPSFALVGYNTNFSEKSDLKLFPIKQGKLQAQVPISHDTLKSVFKIFKDVKTEKKELSFKGIIPQNVIAFKSNVLEQKIIWTVKATQKHLLFKEVSELENGMYSIPKLVFCLNKDTLYVYAIKKGAINENMKLHHAPFLNVYENGSVCMGSANIKTTPFSYVEDVITYVENLFFNSAFTHTNHHVIIKGNLHEYLKKTKDTNIEFNEKLLIENKKTLIDLI